MGPDPASDVLGRILAADVDEDVMRALSTREQRYVLYYLLDHERATLDEFADVVAGWMAATERTVTTSVDRDGLRVALHHTHLPKLDDVGLVAFDPAEGVADRSPLSEAERDLVETAYVAEHRTDENSE